MLLETATLLSGIGNAVAMVALPWLVLERTGDPSAAGIVGAATALPLLASSLFSGTLVDLVGRRRMAVASDVCSAAAVAAIPIVDEAVGLTVPILVVLAALGALFDPAGVTARETLLPAAAEEAGANLARVNGLHETVWGAAFLIGPGVAGVLIGWWGADTTLLVTVAGFAASALLVALVRQPGAGRPPEHEQPDGVWHGTLEGLRFLWADPLLRAIAVLTTAVVAVYLPIEGVILPVYFEASDQPAALGLVVTAMGAGGVAGAIGYSAWGHRLPRRALFVGSLVVTGVGVLAMAFLPPFGWLLVLGSLVGLAYGPIGPLTNLAMQVRTPERLRGRVLGVITSTGIAAGPLGYLIVGPLIEATSVEATFLGVGVLLLVLLVSSVWVRPLRLLDDAAFDVDIENPLGHQPSEAPLHPGA